MSKKGRIQSEAERIKRSESLKKYWDNHPEAKKERSKLFKGRKISSVTRSKISAKLKGVKHSSERRAKQGAVQIGILAGEKHPMYGKKHKPQSIEKNRQSNLGSRNGMYGKTHSEEVKKKQAERMKGNAYRLGKNFTQHTKDLMSLKKSGCNHPKWIKDRNVVAKNEAIYQQILKFLNLPLGANITNKLMIKELRYTKQQFIKHYENQFYDDMTWLNRGKNKDEWQGHHKIQVSWFFEFGIYDIGVINALKNLQPLYHKDHWTRHKELNKFTIEQRKFWVELFIFYVESKRRQPLDISEINQECMTSFCDVEQNTTLHA